MATERFEIIFSARGLRGVQRDMGRLGQQANATRKALGFLRAALVVFASVQIVRGLIDFADTLTTIRNRLRLVTGSVDELNTVQAKLFEISQRTRTSFAENAEFFNRLARATQSMKLNFGELATVTEGVAIAIKVSGASTTEAIGGIRQLSQALAAGAAQGEELRSIVENLPRLASTIAKQFKIAGGELIAFNKAFEGAVTAEAIVRGTLEEIEILREELSQVKFTAADAFQVLSNQMVLFLGNLSDATGAGRALNDLILGIAKNLGLITTALAAFAAITVFNLLVGQVATLSARMLLFGKVATSAVSPVFRLFLALLSPIALVRAAMVSLGGVIVATLKPFAVLAVLAGKAILGLLNPVRSLVRLMGLLRVAVLTNPLFLIGAAVVGGIVAAFFLLRDEVGALIERFGGLRQIFDNIVTAGVATVNTLVRTWKILPAAVADLMIQLANFVIRNFESAINSVIRGVNSAAQAVTGLFDRSSDSIKKEITFLENELDRLRADGAGEDSLIIRGTLDRLNELRKPVEDFVVFNEISLGRITNSYEGAAQQIADVFNEEFAAIVAEGGGIAVVTRKLEDLFAMVQGLAGNLAIDPELLKNLPTLTGSEDSQGIPDDDGLTRRIQSLLASISPLIEANFKLADAQEAVREAMASGNPILISLINSMGGAPEVMRRVTRELVGVGNVSTEVKEKTQLLTAAFKAGDVSATEFARALRKLRLEELEELTTADAGIERFFLKFEDQLADTATIVEETLGAAFRGVEDVFVEFVTTGKLSFKSLVNSILADLARLAFRKVLLDIFKPGNSGPDPISGIFGAFGKLIGLNEGGSFMVGGNGGIDRNVLSLNGQPVARVSKGEKVDVTPARSAQGGGGDVVINGPLVSVSTPDAGSFQRSDTQIGNQVARALERARRRNG